MAMDLIVGRGDEVVIASSDPLPGTVARVEFYNDTKTLVLIFEDKSLDDMMLPVEVDRRILPYLQKSGSITVATFRGGRPQDGAIAPLVQIGMTQESANRT